MSKHRTRNTIDELIELKMLERFESMFKPQDEAAKKAAEKKAAPFWQHYMFWVIMYPIVGPIAWGFLKLSQLAMLNLASIN